MKSFFKTSHPYEKSDSFFPRHNVTLPAAKFTLVQAYHDLMRMANLTPYNMLWHWVFRDAPPELDEKQWGNFYLTNTLFFDGKAFRFPPDMEAEAKKWAGHPYMLHHIPITVWDNPNRLKLGPSAGLGQSKFEETASVFYPAAEKYLRDLGLIPYIMIDEPPILVDETVNPAVARPIEEQPASVFSVLRLARAVVANSTIPIGPCLTSGWKFRFWKQLQAPFSWWIFIDDTRSYGRGAEYRPEYAAELGDAEKWIYFVDTPWLDGVNVEAEMARIFGNAYMNNMGGLLHWTFLRYDNPRYQFIVEPPDIALNEKALAVANGLRTPPAIPEFATLLLQEGEKSQLIFINPNAALQKRILKDGFTVTGNEFDFEYLGEAWVAQRAESAATGEVRVYYAPTWDYNRVEYIERPQ